MPGRGEEIPLEQYFADRDPRSRELFEAVRRVVTRFGPIEVRATKSQVAFRHRRAFAWVWIPGQYLGERDALAPLVLTVDLKRRSHSHRWKQVVEPRHGRFTHHMELRDAEQLDEEVVCWLHEAWVEAG